MKNETNFIGKDGFYWFIGVVEDRIDPLKIGRVRIRVLGAHSELLTLIPTDELFWAQVAAPITSASMNGIGFTPIGLVPGTWVYGFFKDGDSAQCPVVLYSLGGIPANPADNSQGFSDPRNNPDLFEQLVSAPKKIESRSYPNNGGGAILVEETSAKTYPRTINPLGCIVGEPDTNRLARNENITDTIVQVKTDQRDLNIPVALDADNPWDEPITSYNAEYPFNQVFESESGHIIEIDDTPNNERLHTFHRTGTFEEIGPDGSKITKVIMDNYTVILRDNLVHIQGVCNITVDGNANIYVGYDANIEVNNDTNLVTKGDLNSTTFGKTNIIGADDVSILNQSDCTIITEGDLTIATQGTTSIENEGDILVATSGVCQISANEDVTVQAIGSVCITGGLEVDINSEIAINLTAPIINLNRILP